MGEDNPTRATRFPHGMDEKFTEFRDVNDMTSSEALRTLVRMGLEEAQKDPLDDRPDTLLAGLLWDGRRDIHKFLIASVLAYLASQFAGGLLAGVFLTVSVLYSLTVVVSGLDALLLNSAVLRRAMTSDSDPRGEVEA